MNLNQVTLPAADLEASASFYRRMGFTQIVGAPHYARFECTEGDATFSIHQAVPVPDTGVVVYFECSRLDERVAELQREGFHFTRLPTDERWLWREARLLDPAGNVLCLFWGGENRKNPPWRL
ncbi:MAG TPA: VOC family protein [Longimicrobium sp.]|jgi:catechol 2,3-dioxygenase-like lactoylglutathione lyase family enzyme